MTSQSHITTQPLSLVHSQYEKHHMCWPVKVQPQDLETQTSTQYTQINSNSTSVNMRSSPWLRTRPHWFSNTKASFRLEETTVKTQPKIMSNYRMKKTITILCEYEEQDGEPIQTAFSKKDFIHGSTFTYNVRLLSEG